MRYPIERGNVRMTLVMDKDGVRLLLEAHLNYFKEHQVDNSSLKYQGFYNKWYTIVDHKIPPTDTKAGRNLMIFFANTYMGMSDTTWFLDDIETTFSHDGKGDKVTLTITKPKIKIEVRTEETAFIAALIDDFFGFDLTGGIKDLSASLRNVNQE